MPRVGESEIAAAPSEQFCSEGFFEGAKLVGIILRVAVQLFIVADDDSPLIFWKLLHPHLGTGSGFFKPTAGEEGLRQHHRQNRVLRIVHQRVLPRLCGARVVSRLEIGFALRRVRLGAFSRVAAGCRGWLRDYGRR